MKGWLEFAPPEASTLAPRVDRLFDFILGLDAFFVVLIFGLIIAFAYKYYHSRGRTSPPTHRFTTLIEITWTAIPLVIVAFIFVWGSRLFLQASAPPKDAEEILVVGKQWMWKIEHQNGIREINTLHVPTGRSFKLLMISQDVIHDFYVPAFRTKQDVLPEEYTTLWFTATKPGSYHIFCSQYCGTQHSHMRGQVIVMQPSAYETWLSTHGQTLSAVARGEQLFHKYGCVQCHQTNESHRAPPLNGVYGSTVLLSDGTTVVADEGYLRESIVRPAAKIVSGWQAIMPTYEGHLREDEVLDLVAYIKSLAGEVPPTPH